MIVEVSNNIVIKEPSNDCLNYLKSNYVIDNPDYIVAKKLGKNTNRMPSKMKLYAVKNNNYVLPFGCLQDVWRNCKGATLKTMFHDWHKVDYNSVSLYDYQQTAVQKMINAKNGILEAPCGSGKTRMGLAIISLLKGRALWLTHTHQLLNQSLTNAKNLFKGVEFGVISEGEIQLGSHITFATIQTLCKTDLSELKDYFDIIVVDECHHAVGSYTRMKMFFKVVNALNCRYKYGLSATLKRSDGLEKTMFSLLGNVVHTIEKSYVGDKIIKAQYIAINNYAAYNLFDSSVINYDGTFNYTNLITMLSEDTERNLLILNNIMQNLTRTQIVLCPRRSQAEWFYDKLQAHGALLVLGGKRKDFSEFSKYKIIIATEQLAKEGLDYPALDTLHLLTPMNNKGTIEQCVGRVERACADKFEPIVYDYVDINIPYCIAAARVKKRVCNK